MLESQTAPLPGEELVQNLLELCEEFKNIEESNRIYTSQNENLNNKKESHGH